MAEQRHGEPAAGSGGRVVVLGPDDDLGSAGVDPRGVRDLGPATPAALAAVRGGPGALMMSFAAEQLPELALAVLRGVRVVRVEDVTAALEVCRTIEALEDAERAAP